MTRLSDFLGRGIVPISQLTITTATTLNFDESILGLVVLIGGGGGGGAAIAGDTGTEVIARLHGQGGNAGGTVLQLVRFVAGTDYDFVPGAGGAGGGGTSAVRAAYDGTDGGDTTLTSSELPAVLTADGGLGGKGWAAANTGTDSTDHAFQTQLGGANADQIWVGGYGGEILVPVTHAANEEQALASGGGAVNIGGFDPVDLAGGTVNLSAANASVALAGAGAGIMGPGGLAGYTGSTDLVGVATGAGSSRGAGTDLIYSGTSLIVQTSDGGLSLPFSPAVLFPFNGSGGDGKRGLVSDLTGDAGGDGGGGGGLCVENGAATGGSAFGGAAGLMGGGGGVCTIQTSSSFTSCTGGAGNMGGGGGGACNSPYDIASRTVFGGAGGDGVAFVFLLSDFGRVMA